MALLLFNTDGIARGGIIRGRVLIGRWLINSIVVEDQTVSKIHAWITPDPGTAGKSRPKFLLNDGSSYNGTYVNDRAMARRQTLRDGDVIRVGPMEITFSNESELPKNVKPVDLTPKNLAGLTLKGLFFVDCDCGAPLVVKNAFAGRTGRCRFCGKTHVLAPTRRAVAAPAEQLDFGDGSPSTKPKAVCTICQSSMQPTEELHRCPSCGLAFHAECWLENRGCAAYGCAQVGALEPAAPDLLPEEAASE